MEFFDIPKPDGRLARTPAVVLMDPATGLPAVIGNGTGPAAPLTDAQLRATAVPVSGPLTDAQMRATPVGITGSAARTTVTATIPSAASVSNALDLGVTALLGFIAPAAWTAAALNIEVSADNATWAPAVVDGSGIATGSWSSVVAGNAYAVDTVPMLPFRYIRLRSGTFAAPVVQAAARAFVVITRPLA